MTYEVTLISADIKEMMDGEINLGVNADGEQKATLEYEWKADHFTARFVGHAPSMPQPAHPLVFLSKPIEAMRTLMEEHHQYPTDVFKDHKVYFDVPAG